MSRNGRGCYTSRPFWAVGARRSEPGAVPSADRVQRAMNRFFEYTAHHPFLVAAAAILAVLAIVIEIRQRARGSSAIAPAMPCGSPTAARWCSTCATARRLRGRTHHRCAQHARGRARRQRAETLKKYKEKPVIVYCDSGYASAAAARTLRALGFTKVVTLRGGLQSWRQENLPLVKGAAKKDGKHA